MGTSDDWSTVPRYAAPEVVVPGARPTMAGDAYAFGVVLYELARGGRGEVLHPREASLDESVPRPLRDLVASLTHPDPVVRPTLAKARQVLHQLLLDLSEVTIDDTFRAPVEAEDAPPPMPTRIGRYDVVRELGRGGVGVVYEGADPVLERRVALKLLIAGSWARPREVQRFKLEAQAVARLDHPGIVKILDIGGDLEGAWFAMEFVDGPSLADALEARGGRLPWREAVAVAAQVARALQHAHEQGPPAPRRQAQQRAARRGTAPSSRTSASRWTRPPTTPGSPGRARCWARPRTWRPSRPPASSTGWAPTPTCTASACCCTRRSPAACPYEGAHAAAGHRQHPRRRRRAPRGATCRTCPRELDTITLKALRLDPRDRYASGRGLRRRPRAPARRRLDPRRRPHVARAARPLRAAPPAGAHRRGGGRGGGAPGVRGPARGRGLVGRAPPRR
jgi:hypothetical protein